MNLNEFGFYLLGSGLVLGTMMTPKPFNYCLAALWTVIAAAAILGKL